MFAFVFRVARQGGVMIAHGCKYKVYYLRRCRRRRRVAARTRRSVVRMLTLCLCVAFNSSFERSAV